MKNPISFLLLLVLLSALALSLVACPPDDDDSSTSSGQADDDSTPIDDDTTDDDTGDDDTTDDDSSDDDTTDDDSTDDDTTDDDSIDDDTTDDDTGDDDTTGGESDLTILGGGQTGRNGFRVHPAPDGTLYVGAIRGGFLYVYRLQDGVEAADIPFLETYYLAMDIDDQGHYHFLHIDWPTEDLLYTSNASGQWQTMIIDNGIYDDLKAEIVVDSTGAAHVVYVKWIDYSEYYLYYATNRSGSWVVKKIDDTWDHTSNAGPGLYVDADGKAYISYEWGINFKVAHNKYGFWYKKSLEDCPDGGRSSTITLDRKGQINVFYYAYSKEMIRGYAGPALDWTCENLGFGGTLPDVVVDADNHFHLISYYYESDGYSVIYTTNTGGDWSTEALTVPGFGSFSQRRTDIAIDADGELHFAYFNGQQYNLFRADLTPSGWSLDNPITSGGGTRSNCTLALDPSNAPTIAFDTDAFYLAKLDGNHWQIEELPTSGSDVALAVDLAGYHHLFYRGGPYGVMNYLTDASGAWVDTIVDYRSCDRIDFLLDENNHGHAVYACVNYPDKFGYFALYATNQSGEWAIDDPQIFSDQLYGLHLVKIGGTMHIFYGDGDGIRTSYQSGDEWINEPVLTYDTTIEDAVVDAQQNIHLLFWTWDDGLLHADNASGSWAVETVEADVGGNAAMDFDAGGDLHAVYWGAGLRHAVKTEDGWDIQTLLTNDMTWSDCRIRIDGDDLAHVSLLGNEAQWYLAFYVD